MSSFHSKRQRRLMHTRLLTASYLFILVLGFGMSLLNTALPSHAKGHADGSIRPVSNVTPSSGSDRSVAAATSNKSVSGEVISARLPLAFAANQGQADRRIKFFSHGSGYNLLLTPGEAVFEFRNSKVAGKSGDAGDSPSRRASEHSKSQFTTLRMKLVNASPRTIISGADQLTGRQNYFLGNDPHKWRTDVPTFAKVVYEAIYPGIKLTYYGNQRQLEYDFELAPGANPKTIKIACEGIANMKVGQDGDLILLTNGNELRQRRPVAYQVVNGIRVPVEARFVVNRVNEIGFAVGTYDSTKPLVIDPTLIYSSYLGGTGDDSGSSIDVDAGGNLYFTGTTSSTTFPTVNPFRASNAGLADVFVTKLDPTGSTILYSTYVGGGGMDRADGIFVDRTTGAAYLAGRVDSSSTDFPTTPGSFAPSYRGGDFDAVVFKLSPQGNSLIYSTFLGGSENDSAVGIVADANGNAYVTVGTRSPGFPTTVTAFQSSLAGDTDAYLLKFNASGSALLYSTLLGGGGTDRGSSIRIDTAGSAYLVGYTSSPDFPTESAFQNSLGGSFDAFISRIDTTASGVASLVFCTYLGGSSDDKGYGLALDSGNNVYVSGQTSSIDFPVLNPAQPARGGNFDGFVAKISSTGTKTYATYLGGSGDDRATGIAVNSAGNAYVTGYTASTNFPTVSPLQGSNGGGTDAFVA